MKTITAMKTIIAFTTILLLSCSPALAQLSPLNDFFNTGVDASGASLPNFAIDPHWTLTSAPAGSGFGPDAFASNPIPANWVPNTATSRWITPPTDAAGNGPGGLYDYTMSFDMTGFDPTTAVVSGDWASDNMSSILVNGVSTGISHSGGATSFQFFDNFVLDSSNSTFNTGTNNITFRVNNLSTGPTGLHVAGFRGDAVSSVPEPVSATAIGSLALIGLLRRRRKPIRQS